MVTVVTDRWRDLGHWLLNPAPPAWTQVISHQNQDSRNSPQGSENAFSPSKRIGRQKGGHSPHSGAKHSKKILLLYFWFLLQHLLVILWPNVPCTNLLVRQFILTNFLSHLTFLLSVIWSYFQSDRNWSKLWRWYLGIGCKSNSKNPQFLLLLLVTKSVKWRYLGNQAWYHRSAGVKTTRKNSE